MKFIILENWKPLLCTQLTLLIARPRNFIRGPPCEGAETLFLYLSSFLKPQNPFNVSSAFYNCHSFLKIGNSIWGIRFLDLVNNACTSGKREHSVKSRESQQKSAAVHCASLVDWVTYWLFSSSNKNKNIQRKSKISNSENVSST